jgi:hypothetical protein
MVSVPVSTVGRVAADLTAQLRQRERAADSIIWRVVHCEAVGVPSQFGSQAIADALQACSMSLDDLRDAASALRMAIAGRTAATTERDAVEARRREIAAQQQQVAERVAAARAELDAAEGEARRLDGAWAATFHIDDARRSKVTNGERSVERLRRLGWPGWATFDAWEADIAAAAGGRQ